MCAIIRRNGSHDITEDNCKNNLYLNLNLFSIVVLGGSVAHNFTEELCKRSNIEK